MTEEEEGTEEEDEEEMYMREAGQRGDEYVPPASMLPAHIHTGKGVPQLSFMVALKNSEPTAILYITVITPHPIGFTLSQLRNP